MNNIELVKSKFEPSAVTYDAHAHAQKKIADKLAAMVHEWLPTAPAQVLEIGCCSGLLTRRICSAYNVQRYFLNDINECISEILPQRVPAMQESEAYTFLCGDAQSIDLPEEMDLVVSASAVQWFDDLAGFFKRVRQALASYGYMFFSSFGPLNLKEIAIVAGQGLHYHALDDMVAMLEKEFEVLAYCEEEIALHFDEPLDVLKHLKYTGVNGGFCSVWHKSRLNDFCNRYREQFGGSEGVSLTYHPTYFAVRVK